MIIWYTVPETWRVTVVIVIFILGYVLLFYTPDLTRTRKFQKNEKNPGDIILLLMYVKNYDYMMYGS